MYASSNRLICDYLILVLEGRWVCLFELVCAVMLTLMLLVAYLANSKRRNKPEKWLKHWHMGTHLRVLGETYPMNINWQDLNGF